MSFAENYMGDEMSEDIELYITQERIATAIGILKKRCEIATANGLNEYADYASFYGNSHTVYPLVYCAENFPERLTFYKCPNTERCHREYYEENQHLRKVYGQDCSLYKQSEYSGRIVYLDLRKLVNYFV